VLNSIGSRSIVTSGKLSTARSSVRILSSDEERCICKQVELYRRGVRRNKRILLVYMLTEEWRQASRIMALCRKFQYIHCKNASFSTRRIRPLLACACLSSLSHWSANRCSHSPSQICQKQQTINKILVGSESKIRRRAGNYSGNLAVCGQDVSVHGM
jgi:hypothetical protein